MRLAREARRLLVSCAMMALRSAGAQTLDGEFPVNTVTTDAQSYPAAAVEGSGDFVVVWQSHGEDGSGYGIFGQRYALDGTPKGGEFQVNTTTTGDQIYPSVAATEDGRFCVVWQSAGQDGSGNGVYMRTSSGIETRVNTFTAGDQQKPSVAVGPNGNGVVVWESTGQDGSGFGVFGQRLLSLMPVGPEFQINSYTTNSQYNAKAAADQLGDFVVVWQSYKEDGSGPGVFGQLFAANGARVGGEFRVNTTTTGYQKTPAVSFGPNGNFAVVWAMFDGAGQGVFGQVYDASGARLGGQFQVNTTYADDQYEPSIGVDANGDFVVAWFSYATDGSYGNIFAQRYSPSGLPIGGEFEVNTFTPFSQFAPSVSSGSGPGFVVTWASNFQDGSSTGVYAQRGAVTSSDFRVNVITAGNQRAPDVSSSATGQLATVWGTDGSEVHGRVLTALGAPVGAEFVVNTTTAVAGSAPVVASSSSGTFVVVWNGTTSGTFGSYFGIYARRFSSSGVALAPDFPVDPGSFVSSDDGPAVSSDAAGDFVVAWSYSAAFGGSSVAAQRFAASGSPLGTALTVASGAVVDAAYAPSVASDSAGNFVVAYAFSVLVTQYVYAARFDSGGNPRGAAFQVNTYSSSAAAAPSVASDGSGNFVVVWEAGPGAGGAAEDGSGYGIFGRRYDGSGNSLGAEFRVNTHTTGDQLNPRVTWIPSSGFVVVWQSLGQDGSADGVFGQRYSATGVPHGAEFAVNEFTPGGQHLPHVATSSGRFAVVWEGAGDGSGDGVFLRRFSILAGDVNGDGIVDVADVFYLINDLFANGPSPIGPADADGNGVVNVADVFYLINYLFANGPAPK